MLVEFYQSGWEVIKNDLLDLMSGFDTVGK
jgi:hypothetical protein